ncbi:hypothetical protein AAG570_000067 [Ranatra chinensis]|uniref:Uncharacterized protein n=1 Tax=Ranatra chinensis TaxID=642074 RepID=A0ABD0YW04_9HEMI
MTNYTYLFPSSPALYSCRTFFGSSFSASIDCGVYSSVAYQRRNVSFKEGNQDTTGRGTSHPFVTLPDGEYKKKGQYSTRRSRGQRLLSRRAGFKGWVEEDREDTRGLGLVRYHEADCISGISSNLTALAEGTKKFLIPITMERSDEISSSEDEFDLELLNEEITTIHRELDGRDNTSSGDDSDEALTLGDLDKGTVGSSLHYATERAP